MVFEKFIVGNKRVFICEEHHHVLSFWQQFKNLQPFILTFDHHTDLHLAFQNHLYLNYSKERYDIELRKELIEVGNGNFNAIKKLKNDEHIDAAIKSGIIKKALIYAEDSYFSRPIDIYTINGDEKYVGQPIINNPRCYQDCNSIINTKELEYNFQRFDLCISKDEWINNFILDIDLDTFMTTKSICPQNADFFKMLIKKAIAISIAKESHWIGIWRRDYDKLLTVEYLLEKLFELINSAQENSIER